MTVKYRAVIQRAETKVLDEDTYRVQAVVSSESKDRSGDIIRQAGWDLTNFLKHPVLLTSHNYMSIQAQIGEWESMKVKGKELVGTARYYVGEGNPEADWAYRLAEKGMAAYSVGFVPDMAKAKEMDGDGWLTHYEFNGQELLETSQVTVPANADALQQTRGLKLHPAVQSIVDEMLKDAPPNDKRAEIEDALHALKAETGRLREGLDAVKARAAAEEITSRYKMGVREALLEVMNGH